MPVSFSMRVAAVSRDMGGKAPLARLLQVSPARVTRWIEGEAPPPEIRRMVEDLEFALVRLAELRDPDSARHWLQGFNSHLGNRRPIDEILAGRVRRVLEAIQAEVGLSYA